jgi:hypothetical protein
VPADPVRVEDHYFSSSLAERQARFDEGLVPIHVEPPGRSCRDDRNRRRTATGLMVMASGTNLVIVNRGEPTRPIFRWGNYARNILTVPWSRITSFRVFAPSPEQPLQFHRLELHCGDQTLVQPCLGLPSAVLGVLAGQGVPAL